MTDIKISALPLALTPLTGAEVFPIVQSSTTKQVSITNITPKLTTAQRNAIASPANGYMIYNLDVSANQIYAAGTWVDLQKYQFLIPTETAQRNWCTIKAPQNGTNFIDNVLAIQNLSVGYNGVTYVSGNAAFNFLDRAGTERCAMGYSRNASLAPMDGYYANTLYIEIGNPFTTDSDVTKFRLVNTIMAGGPYWGGAAQNYFMIDGDSSTGAITFKTPGTGALGQILTTTNARMRERGATDQFAIATNISDMSSGATLTQDNVALSSWQTSFGGGYDYFDISRAPAGSTSVAAQASLFRINSSGFIGVGTTSLTARLNINNSSGSAIVSSATTSAGSGLNYLNRFVGTRTTTSGTSDQNFLFDITFTDQGTTNPTATTGFSITNSYANANNNTPYNVGFNSSCFVSQNLSGFTSLSILAPNVASGKGLNTWYGIYIQAPAGAGTITTPYAFITDTAAGFIGLGTATPSTLLDVNSDKIRLRTSKTPASAADTGNAGDICWDSSYIYVCTAANTWKRAAIATW